MGTGIWANFHWENGIWVTGTGIWSLGMGVTDRKTIALGLGFLKFGKTIGWGNGIWAKFGLRKWDSYPPFRTLLQCPLSSPNTFPDTSKFVYPQPLGLIRPFI